MSVYSIVFTRQFKKDLKQAKKRGLSTELLMNVIRVLASGDALDAKHRDHALSGNWQRYRECHIQPDLF